MSKSIITFEHKNKDLIITNNKISSLSFVSAAKDANKYLYDVYHMFKNLKINFYESLGITNISGTVGEIFAKFLLIHTENLISNPHPDGRPDILNLCNSEIKTYYNNCFEIVENQQKPIKNLFTPFKYGGIEVKCTAGDIKKSIPPGQSRINKLSGFSISAHHIQELSLCAIYYDYIQGENFLPQIIAGFYADITEEDWNKMCIGSVSSKTTSCTTLSKKGKDKIKNNAIFIAKEPIYYNKLKEIGVNFLYQ